MDGGESEILESVWDEFEFQLPIPFDDQVGKRGDLGLSLGEIKIVTYTPCCHANFNLRDDGTVI